MVSAEWHGGKELWLLLLIAYVEISSHVLVVHRINYSQLPPEAAYMHALVFRYR